MSLPQTSNQFSSLPTIYSANARSVFPKFRDLIQKLQNSRIDLAQISETWQDLNKKDHNDKIDILINKFGYKWYSYARPKYKDDGSLTGGGGSAILVNSRNWLSDHLTDIVVPHGLEVVWVKVAPRSQQSILKILIICGIYSKPNSRKKTLLSDHISMNFYLLKMKHPDAIPFSWTFLLLQTWSYSPALPSTHSIIPLCLLPTSSLTTQRMLLPVDLSSSPALSLVYLPLVLAKLSL